MRDNAHTLYVLICGLNQQLIFKFQILGTDVVYTFEHPISGQQEAEIFDPVIVNPEIVLFPWYPLAPPNTLAQNQFQYLLEVTQFLGAASSNIHTCTKQLLDEVFCDIINIGQRRGYRYQPKPKVKTDNPC